MRPITLPATIAAPSNDFERWMMLCLQEIERASLEDPTQVFDSYGNNTIPTVNRTLNTTAPSLSNVTQVLGTLIEDMRARGVNRTAPT